MSIFSGVYMYYDSGICNKYRIVTMSAMDIKLHI